MTLYWADTKWHCSVCERTIYTCQKSHPWLCNLKGTDNHSKQIIKTAVLDVELHFKWNTLLVQWSVFRLWVDKCYERHLPKRDGINLWFTPVEGVDVEQMLFVSKRDALIDSYGVSISAHTFFLTEKRKCMHTVAGRERHNNMNTEQTYYSTN